MGVVFDEVVTTVESPPQAVPEPSPSTGQQAPNERRRQQAWDQDRARHKRLCKRLEAD